MDSTVTDPAITPARISVVGPGRLGRVLTAALGQAGFEVTGPFARGDRVQRADAVLLCVPDAEIPAAAAAVAGVAPLVGHTSGATPLTALTAAGSEHFGLHPLQSFTGDEGPRHLLGAGCAVAGSSPAALETARELALSLGMLPFELADDDRAAYHAAASVASNFLVTLEGAAEELAGGAGLPAGHARELLAPLVRTTVENWARRGPREALTGPVARGDEQTVLRQRAAVSRTAPHLLALFDAMVDRTRSLAGVAA
jgi:predicted short-subunit dehydrogenase-like oxidoreductase (DUF2520 family)